VFLGASDWGSGLDKAGQRAVIAFAKSDEGLRAHLTGIGLANREFGAVRCVGTELNIRAIDVKRTAWYDQFFNAFAFESPQELLTAVHRTDVDTEMLAQDRDFGENGMGGWVYWLIYVKGALQHAQGEALGAGNVYYDLLARHWKGDPGRVADYGNPERLRALVHRRFRDFALFRANPDAPLEVEPLRLVVTKGPAAPSPTRSVKRIYQIGSEVPVETTTIDGYHRLFLARLFGHAQMPCDFVAEHDAVPGQGA